MAAYKPVTHVIFDLDGTLLGTEHVYTKIYQSIAERYGKLLTWKLRAKCMGRKADESIATMIRELQLPLTVGEFQNIAQRDFFDTAQEEFLSSEKKPGVERLVKHLHANKIPIAIATSSNKETYDLKVKNHHDIFNMFHHVVLIPHDIEAIRGKPAPDAYLVCANRFEDRPSPEKVLVFEDAPSGVQAAVAAGMQVVMVPDPRVDVMFRENATLVLTSMEHFRPEIFGLPPFTDV